MREKPFHSKNWLWWCALFSLLAGAAFDYLIYSTMPLPKIISPEMRQIAMVSVVISGICVISATSHWWTRR